jgi:hypothetical protein
MISLPHALPYIRIGSSSLALCESDWLAETLSNAASGTDVPDWMARDISRGVESYLANHFHGTVIDSADLFARIEKTLMSLGLDHVAAKIDRTPPPVRISLTDLARRAGSGRGRQGSGAAAAGSLPVRPLAAAIDADRAPAGRQHRRLAHGHCLPGRSHRRLRPALA